MTAVGDLVSSDGKLEFKVTGSKDVYEVVSTPHASWSKQAGKQVTVTGRVPALEGKQKENTMQITQATPQGKPK